MALTKSLDEQTLDAVADLICGDGSPWYRKGWEIPKFFERAGLKCVAHDSTTRKWWTIERLREYNRRPADIESVLLRVMNPFEYKGDEEQLRAAVARLDAVLKIEGLRVEFDGVTPRLSTITARVSGSTKILRLDPPDFSKITTDGALAIVLRGRWDEAQSCVEADNYLAALILMGSLLEGTILAIIHANPATANRSKSAPRDQEGKTKKFYDWTLSALIDVAHDCDWLQRDVKDFAHLLREYRNMIHPWQQVAMRMEPDADTCKICWEVVRAALNDIGDSARQ